MEFYHDITGNVGSLQPNGSAVNPGMRAGLIHLVSGVNLGTGQGSWEDLGPYSYFSESAFYLPDWKTRLWSAAAYPQLLAVKQRVDPSNLLTCRHCVGDEDVGVAAGGSCTAKGWDNACLSEVCQCSTTSSCVCTLEGCSGTTNSSGGCIINGSSRSAHTAAGSKFAIVILLGVLNVLAVSLFFL